MADALQAASRCFINPMVTLALWYVGLSYVLKGYCTLGDVTAFAALVPKLREGLGIITQVYRDALNWSVSLNRIMVFLKKEPAIDRNMGIEINRGSMQGKVDFREVTFTYPTRPGYSTLTTNKENPTLSNITFSLMPGKVTALCGPIGSGKSSIAKLMFRDYYVSGDGIFFDGIPLHDYNWCLLHREMAIVSQETGLLSGSSVAMNIKFGIHHRTVSDEEVMEAARKANIHDFIMTLPEAYDTPFGEKVFTPGEKQCIAIARAILMDPKIVVLDEATSSLDAISEREVQNALEQLQKGRTTLMIAHHLKTIRNADSILVLDNGSVQEEGNHKDLMAQKGLYAKLCSAAN
jgi:ABC-type multidrug transport system fused ATPase/permease subunit